MLKPAPPTGSAMIGDAELMYRLDEGGRMLRCDVRLNPVTQIAHVAAAVAIACEQSHHLFPDPRR